MASATTRLSFSAYRALAPRRLASQLAHRRAVIPSEIWVGGANQTRLIHAGSRRQQEQKPTPHEPNASVKEDKSKEPKTEKAENESEEKSDRENGDKDGKGDKGKEDPPPPSSAWRQDPLASLYGNHEH